MSNLNTLCTCLVIVRRQLSVNVGVIILQGSKSLQAPFSSWVCELVAFSLLQLSFANQFARQHSVLIRWQRLMHPWISYQAPLLLWCS